MPSSETHPSKVPMWRGVNFAYLIIGMCYFPLAIAGYWAYGNSIPTNGGLLKALEKYHGLKASTTVLAVTCVLVVINSLSSFQIYAMSVFDNLELRYVSRTNQPCPLWLPCCFMAPVWLLCCFRAFFSCLAFFISVALPFLPSLAGLIGGVALPLTLAYPCFMWSIINKGIETNLFNPK